MMAKVEKARVAECKRWIKGHPEKPGYIITRRKILRDFEAAALVDGLTWRESLYAVGVKYGLIDVGGRPTSKWAAAVIAKARKAHRRQRKDFLEGQMAEARFRSGDRSPGPISSSYSPNGAADP